MGKVIGSGCPRMASTRHGAWGFVVRIPSTSGRRQLRRGGFTRRIEAEAALTLVHRLLEVADRDPTGADRIGDLIFAATRNGGALPSFDEVRRRYSRGQVLVDTTTVADWLATWLADKARSDTRPGTVRGYAQHVRDYLSPHLGDLRLAHLRPSHVSDMLAAIRADKRLSAASVQRVRATLRSALADAVRHELVTFNTAAHASVPTAPRPEVRPLEPEQIGHLLDVAGTDRMGALIELAVLTGLRRGELLGLRWSDVDLERSVVHVRQQVTQDVANLEPCASCGRAHRGLRFSLPKTRSSEARVDLDARAVGALMAHRLQQDVERTGWGAEYADHGLVFAREDGDPYDPAVVTRTFKRLAKAAGLPADVWFHAATRHGHASMLLAAGVDIAIVSKRLRHSSISITSDTYSHLLEGVGRRAAEAASALLPARSTPECDDFVTAEAPKMDQHSRREDESAGQGGGPRGTRTHNPRIKSPLLCQLS